MKKGNKLSIILICLYVLAGQNPVHARSVYREPEVSIPELSVSWDHLPDDKYTIKDSHIEPYPLFKIFDEKHFNKHLMSKTKNISFRSDKKKKIKSKALNALIEKLLDEVLQRKRAYSDFIVISNKNFNRRKAVGMMVLKFKEYPFIFKLYIETPKSFINPYGKGLDNIWFFPMGGGTNRHIAGLTRIKNLELIKKKLAKAPEWASIFDLPRKWHWLPPKKIWLTLQGTNVGPHAHIKAKIPAIYGIVTDAIDGHNDLSLLNSKHTTMVLGLTNYLDHFIDSHIDNFMIENGSNKIVIIDTEHFPTVVGIKEKVTFNNYFEWFSYLASKCAKDWFFRSKKDRHIAQHVPHGQSLA